MSAVVTEVSVVGIRLPFIILALCCVSALASVAEARPEDGAAASTLVVWNPTAEGLDLPFGAAFVEGWCPKDTVLRVRVKTPEIEGLIEAKEGRHRHALGEVNWDGEPQLEALTQVESREDGTRFGVYAPLTHGRVEIEVDAGEAGSVRRAFTHVADAVASARDLALASLAAWRGGWLESWELERHLDPHRDSVSAQLAELLPHRTGQDRILALALMTNIPPRDPAARDAVLEMCRPVLIESWRTADLQLRFTVTRLLAAYGSPGAVALARETLGAEDGGLVGEALHILSRAGAEALSSPGLIQQVAGLVLDSRRDVDRRATRVLARAGEPGHEAFLDVVTPNLVHEDAAVRRRALGNLTAWWRGGRSYLISSSPGVYARKDALVAHLACSARNRYERSLAHPILWDLGSAGREPVIRSYLDTEVEALYWAEASERPRLLLEWPLRLEPLWDCGLPAALADRAPVVLEALRRGLENEETRSAFQRIATHFGHKGLVWYFESLDGNGELVLALVLRGIRSYPSAWCTRSYLVDRIFDRMLRSKDERMHALGAYAVYRWRGDAGPLRAAGGLDVLESSEIPALREMAAYGMHVLGRDAAIPRLEKLLEDRAENVHVEAWWALGKLGE